MNIVSFRDWSGQNLPELREIVVPSRRVVIHHGASGTSSVQTLRAYLRGHQQDNGWLTVGYNFLVAEGEVFEGRGAGMQGAQAEGHNRETQGIVIAGDYDINVPADRDLQAASSLLRHGVREGWWEPEVVGHRDVGQTWCPGRHLYPLLPTLMGGTFKFEEGDVFVVRYGQQGPRVMRAQIVLRAAAQNAGLGDLLPRYGADGHYGDETAVAVNKMAARVRGNGMDGLPQDGFTGMDVLLLDYCRNWLR